MSIMNGGQSAWPPPGHPSRPLHHASDAATPNQPAFDASALAPTLMPEASDIDDDSIRRQRNHFSDLFRRADDRIDLLFSRDGAVNPDALRIWRHGAPSPGSSPLPPTTDHAPIEEPPAKRVKRVIDEDDYGDDDDDEDDEDADGGAGPDRPGATSSPLKNKSAATANKGLLSPSKSGSSPVQSVTSPDKLLDKSKDDGSQSSQGAQAKSSEDARKQLEEARKDSEASAKRSFHTLFYTLENDRTAMLEQQQLEESEKQLEAEIDKNASSAPNGVPASEVQGSLSSANLGASSLTLKHLIARIDMKRDQVKASDAELRSLMNEVRKNRSKWASEENVNQEELYEALEKVLTELKAHTEYSTPFLQRVNKRDAPDYYNLIKQPMDLGSMTKKLKTLAYKSKQDFVHDLNLIWDNCLRYNQDSAHPLRRMANGMRKEAEKLIPLIPDLVIRPRAEVEAEERRKQNGGDDAGDDDSDDEPIMSSRGRIATGNKGTKSRKQPTDNKEGTPNTDQKPVLNGLLAKVQREGSELDGSNGFSTPGGPVGGSMTPTLNGQPGSNLDAMDIDGPSLNGMTLGHAFSEAAQQAYEDEDYKIWKQITKKDRALIAKDRNQLFKENKLHVDEPALLRTKHGMRWFLKNRQQAEALREGASDEVELDSASGKGGSKAIETLAEGMEESVEKVVPDYYEPTSLVPDIPSRLQWIEDSDGQVINQHEEFLAPVPRGYFTAPDSKFTRKMDGNLRQMQETRKVCSKIGVIKQMQLQTQTYANQFPKYNPEPFFEADIEPHVTCGDGLVMAPEVCRGALQRSVAKIFCHAGFEELQPSALDTVTDIAADYFGKIVNTFKSFSEVEKKDPTPVQAKLGITSQPRWSPEEVVLHTLAENGHSVEALESFSRDEIDRLSNKLGVMHDRMKSHLSELLRPAVQDGSQDGASNFNDGNEQFVTGDFAEELGEDFFGFKELGLDEMLGGSLQVPLHLLQSRVRNQYQVQNPVAGTTDTHIFEDLTPLDPVTKDNIQGQVGLVKNFFLAKLHANDDKALVEDEDLPTKQKRPRPRLGATGKIVSPQKRSPKEQNAINKKKKKLEAQAAANNNNNNANVNNSPEKPGAKKAKPGGSNPGNTNSTNDGSSLPVAPKMERMESAQSQENSHADKDDVNGMMSPESMER